MTLNADEIKRKMAVIKEMANKRSQMPVDGTSSVTNYIQKLVGQWTELAAAGATLISGNADLKNTALDAEDDKKFDTWMSSKGLQLLKAVVNTRERLLKAQKNIEDLAEDISKGISGQIEVEDEPHSEGLRYLLSITVPEALLTELNAEAFDDLCGKAAARRSNALQEQLTQLQKQLQTHYRSKGGTEEDSFFEALAKDGSKSWSIDLTTDCEKSADEIHQIAQPTLLSLLPGKAMKTFAKYVEEARLAPGL